jgi:hypothetical protein
MSEAEIFPQQSDSNAISDDESRPTSLQRYLGFFVFVRLPGLERRLIDD